MTTFSKIELSDSSKREINTWLKKFPPQEKRSAIIPALTIVQKENGGALTKELIVAVAEFLEVAENAVFEVATFYHMYSLRPAGKHKIAVCTNISCNLCGCDTLVSHLKDKLGIGFGEVTKDQKFDLEEAECLGACDGAPAILVNSECYMEVTPDKLDAILDNLD